MAQTALYGKYNILHVGATSNYDHRSVVLTLEGKNDVEVDKDRRGMFVVTGVPAKVTKSQSISPPFAPTRTEARAGGRLAFSGCRRLLRHVGTC